MQTRQTRWESIARLHDELAARTLEVASQVGRGDMRTFTEAMLSDPQVHELMRKIEELWAPWWKWRKGNGGLNGLWRDEFVRAMARLDTIVHSPAAAKTSNHIETKLALS